MPLFDSALLVIYAIALFFTIFWLCILIENKPIRKLKEIKKYPSVSITVPAYNEEGTIEKTITSVLNLDYPQDKLDLILVNDGSTDNTLKIMQDYARKYNFIKVINKRNAGKGAAINDGLRIAKGEFFACLDADSTVEKDTLKKMLRYFITESTAVVLPLMKIRDSKKIVERIQHCEYLVNMYYKFLMSKLDCVHVSPGPFSLYRTNVLIKEGGFDENNLTEDLEVTLRLQSKHYKIVQTMDAVVYTIGMNSIKKLYKQRNRWYKGTMLNLKRYRHLIFNRKYGDFGLIQMPSILISAIFSLILLYKTTSLLIVDPIRSLFNKLSLANYDIMDVIGYFISNFNILDLNYFNVVIMGIVLLTGIVIFKYAFKTTNEKIFKGAKSFLPLAFYFCVYFLFLGTVWAGVTLDLILNRKQKW